MGGRASLYGRSVQAGRIRYSGSGKRPTQCFRPHNVVFGRSVPDGPGGWGAGDGRPSRPPVPAAERWGPIRKQRRSRMWSHVWLNGGGGERAKKGETYTFYAEMENSEYACGESRHQKRDKDKLTAKKIK